MISAEDGSERFLNAIWAAFGPTCGKSERLQAKLLESYLNASQRLCRQRLLAVIDRSSGDIPVDDIAGRYPPAKRAKHVAIWLLGVRRIRPDDLPATTDRLHEESAAGCRIAIVRRAQNLPFYSVAEGLQRCYPCSKRCTALRFKWAALNGQPAP